MKAYLKILKDGIPASYSQVFFADSRFFTACLLIASFIDPRTGLSGIIAVITALTAAHILGLNPLLTKNGYYTYNALLVGFALGAVFPFSCMYVFLLIVAALITLLFTVWTSSVTLKYKLPILSLPFIVGIWLMLLSMHTFHMPFLQPRLSEPFYALCSGTEINIQQLAATNALTHFLFLYFKAMAAVFFQHSVIAGMLITLGLLVYSRISFSLSLIGFAAGFIFFRLFYPGIPDFNFNWIAFNFILTALAIGFFLVASGASYLLTIIAILITVLLISALGVVVQPYALPLYSLPFTVCVMLLIAVLNNRYSAQYLHLVHYQFNSPEKNLYTFRAAAERFKKDTYIHIHLPFYGEWQISQGHAGNITHKDAWRYAWDFVVTDESGHTARTPAASVSDFYCYGLPVTAPADGLVTLVEDGIADNHIGDMDLRHNWGNTIVIKHAEGLYSKISHVVKGSFKVKTGDYVKKGDLLALCGNSGRSPEPHIHFQLQATPQVGSETLKYPLSYYITKEKQKYTLKSFDYPAEGETVIRPTPTVLLQQAFHFIPGMKLEFNVENGTKKHKEQWEVFTDSSNFSYLYCHNTRSVAYFANNETFFYFTSFKGDTNSLLYYFYLAAYKISLSYFQELEINDVLPISENSKSLWKPLQDFIAPFYIFMRSTYKAVYSEADNNQLPKKIKINSEVITTGITHKESKFVLEIEHNKIKTISVNSVNLCITATNTAS